MNVVVGTTIEIDADPQAVWDVLIDFAAYGEWNPFMDSIAGTTQLGNKTSRVP